MARLFGTDGVRGVANQELTCELAYKIGYAGAYVLASLTASPVILVGRDTRRSGNMLSYALMAGICAAGANVVDMGVVTTPGIAYLTREYDADAGVVVSASHYSFEFNGIKWFNGNGYKLSDQVEDMMEQTIADLSAYQLPTGAGIGCSREYGACTEQYIEHLANVADVSFEGMTVALDCANGAAYEIAPEVFKRLGARVITSHDRPDGININDGCGSTHPQSLQKLVLASGADLGLAFDGDADRLIAVDEKGTLVDGDRIMALCARDMKRRGKLNGDCLVATVMSNAGMVNSLKADGIDVIRTAVGDRYVLERMLSDGYNLGGEQSGHLIFTDDSTTGDGILSGVKLMSVLRRKDSPLSELAHSIDIYPQKLLNICVPNEKKEAYKENDRISSAIEKAEAAFAGMGRVLVRVSGTEPLIRVMMEGADEALVMSEVNRVANVIAEELNGQIV